MRPGGPRVAGDRNLRQGRADDLDARRVDCRAHALGTEAERESRRLLQGRPRRRFPRLAADDCRERRGDRGGTHRLRHRGEGSRRAADVHCERRHYGDVGEEGRNPRGADFQDRRHVVVAPVPDLRHARGRGELGGVCRPLGQVREVLRRQPAAFEPLADDVGGRVERRVRPRLQSVGVQDADFPLHGKRDDRGHGMSAGAVRARLLRHGDEGPHGRARRSGGVPADGQHDVRRSRRRAEAGRWRVQRLQPLRRRGRRAFEGFHRPVFALPRAVHRSGRRGGDRS